MSHHLQPLAVLLLFASACGDPQLDAPIDPMSGYATGSCASIVDDDEAVRLTGLTLAELDNLYNDLQLDLLTVAQITQDFGEPAVFDLDASALPPSFLLWLTTRSHETPVRCWDSADGPESTLLLTRSQVRLEGLDVHTRVGDGVWSIDAAPPHAASFLLLADARGAGLHDLLPPPELPWTKSANRSLGLQLDLAAPDAAPAVRLWINQTVAAPEAPGGTGAQGLSFVTDGEVN